MQCNSTIHRKTFITSGKETSVSNVAGTIRTFIYAWCCIHTRHVS